MRTATWIGIVLGARALVACGALAGLEDPSPIDDRALLGEAGVETGAPGEAGGDAILGVDDGGGATDADVQQDAARPPTASFVLECNGKPLPRRTCANKRWEYDDCPAPQIGTRSVVLRNDGQWPVGYIARRSWSTTSRYVPGYPKDGQSGELSGFVQPGGTEDLSSAYAGGTIALFGAGAPFDPASVTSPKDDEGTIPWDGGSYGGVPTTTVNVAEISVPSPYGPCFTETKLWD